MKNILMLNAGTRNKLVQYFKKDLANEARVIATDNYFLAPALYEADGYYVTKRWDEEGYWEQIDEICRREQIGLILSLVDPELELLAKQKDHFSAMGILTNIGNEQVVHNCFDKYSIMQFLKEQGYPCIRTYTSVEQAEQAVKDQQLQFPLFVKPRYGSGSADIHKISNPAELRAVCTPDKEMIIQEYMDAQELGVDVYVDLVSREVISIFAKKKLKMRAGETDKSVSYKDQRLFDRIESFAREFQLEGVNDIDVFERNGEYYISEVNPRFGGGYLHAYECGQRYPQYLIHNMNGAANKRVIGNYESDVYMMKYFDIKVARKEDVCV